MIEKVLQMLKDYTKNEEIQSDTKLISTGILESISVISLISEFEDEFGVEFDLQDLEFEQFNTAESIADIIQKIKN